MVWSYRHNLRIVSYDSNLIFWHIRCIAFKGRAINSRNFSPNSTHLLLCDRTGMLNGVPENY